MKYPKRGHGVRLFDPRYDAWVAHFAFVHGHLLILGITDVGMATEKALVFNDVRPNNRVGLRHVAIKNGEYPPDWARDLAVEI